VLTVDEHRLRETLRLKLASCRENVELASNGLQWTPDSATLSIRWLVAPGTDQQQTTRAYRIDSSGEPALLAQQ
jgi:hypothetical protein